MNRPSSKKRNLVAGGALVAALGLFLFFKGPGFGGGGSGDGDGDNTAPSDVEVNLQSSQTNVPDDDADDTQEVVDILIDNETYLVVRADGSRTAASLDDLKSLIAAAPGNADGIKVRISKKASSLLDAERALDALLESSGLEETAIRRVPDPVDAN